MGFLNKLQTSQFFFFFFILFCSLPSLLIPVHFFNLSIHSSVVGSNPKISSFFFDTIYIPFPSYLPNPLTNPAPSVRPSTIQDWNYSASNSGTRAARTAPGSSATRSTSTANTCTTISGRRGWIRRRRGLEGGAGAGGGGGDEGIMKRRSED